MLDSGLRDSVEIGFEVDGYGSECKPVIEDSHEAPGFAIQGVRLDAKSLHLVPRFYQPQNTFIRSHWQKARNHPKHHR